jgi:hypothetical protein
MAAIRGPLAPDDPIFSKGLISVFGRPSAPVEDDRADDERNAELPADEDTE